jgi:mannose-6-phosphate isomerase class I
VHALGNPEGRGVLALEIRMPGPTFRAWDNVRFPLRDIDVDAALGALNLGATKRSEFVVARKPVRPGVHRSVDCDRFRLEHLKPTKTRPIDVPASAPHSLHVLAGRVTMRGAAGGALGALKRGESALVPVGVGAYRVVAASTPVEVVRVELPPYG